GHTLTVNASENLHKNRVAKPVEPVGTPLKAWADPEVVQVLRSVQPRNEDVLKADYVQKGLHLVPDTFVLYRIIGNDLYPRHAIGQSRENVEFILNNEEQFPNCSKYWVLNRLVDQRERQAIIALLESHGQSYSDMPLVIDE